MSISTMSTGARHYTRRSASSILSTDSDIRFTRKKLSSQYRCGCCIIASFLLLLLLAAAALYFGYTYLAAEPLEEQVFRASLKVLKGDKYSSDLADPSSEKFKEKSREYRERLNLLFRRSYIRYGFAGTDILALDGQESKDLIVHFNIHIDPTYVNVKSADLEKLLHEDIESPKPTYFQNLTVDPKTIEVKENLIPTTSTPLPTAMTKSEAMTQTPKPPRRCSPLQVKYCGNLGYNVTTYPNILGHESLQELEEDFIAFRELVDAECHRLAYEFICQVLQPPCKRGDYEDEMVLPCRSFCRDFMVGCGGRLSSKLKELLDCSHFPEFGDGGSCNTKPGCVQELQSRALSPRICDGVVDCQDLSDEKSCTYCPSGQIHCGIGRVCIDLRKRCDGQSDCPDGSDERACLRLAPNIDNITKVDVVTPHLPRYHSEGFVVFTEKGESGKLCTENLGDLLPANKSIEVLHTVASSLCKTLGYEKLTSVQEEKDTEHGIPYVKMNDPLATEISFVRTPCETKQVLKVGCETLECGSQITHSNGLNPLSKMSSHGDFPWHSALFKEDIHICDGTLVSPTWIVTTQSCFQGQPKAEWTARFGSVRLSTSAPWQQERRLVELFKSPVEGSTVAMVKLEDPVYSNDFVRPICLPKRNLQTNSLHCNTMGWARNRDQLQRVQLRVTEMAKCENVSISTLNSLCTEMAYGQDDCNEEEFAGSSLICLNPDDGKWSLVGVTNWRIGCSKSGADRPRMYDKISSNVDWILETLAR